MTTSNEDQVAALKSEFISTVSHELRTPLTSIGGYVKLIQEGDAGPVTDTQQEFLAIIETNVRRLTALINDILDIDRLQSTHLSIRKEPQDLREILRECRERLLIQAHQKGLDLRLDLPREIPLILGERRRLVQIFENLLSNAIKYTAAGFVEIKVRVDEDQQIVILVADSGIGLDADERSKLFQKFYRSDSSLNRSEQGTGLGLVITKALVEAHGGKITVTSEKGKGSTFETRFPITAPTVSIGESESGKLTQAIQEIEESQKKKRIPETIWIIDDNTQSREHFQSLIENAANHGVFEPGRNFKARCFQNSEEVPFLVESEPSPVAVIFNPSEEEKLSDLKRRLRGPIPIVAASGDVNSKDFWNLLSDVVKING
jgi:light-regulated signal transduction histidine kinase (bacteriophytochrome)